MIRSIQTNIFRKEKDMKKRIISIISCVLAFLMVSSVLVSCAPTGTDETTGSQPEETTETKEQDSSTDESNTTESASDLESDTKESEDTTEETDPPVVELTGEFADSIENASNLSNKVQAYYLEGTRNNYRVENLNMVLDYALSGSKPIVTALKNTQGGIYLENTMDAYVKMEDGSVFYASNSSNAARPNIYKYGYYYYDVHFLDHNFVDVSDATNKLDISIDEFSKYKDVTRPKANKSEGSVMIMTTGSDPYIYTSYEDGVAFSTEKFNTISFDIKSTNANSGKLYFVAGGVKGHNEGQCVNFTINPDGEYHTYTLKISDCENYTGEVSAIRIDFEGTKNKESIYVKDVKALNIDYKAPSILFDRELHTYSDKMNQVLHFVAQKETTGISEFGMVTKIAKDTVDKMIVKDASGTHESLDGVDFSTLEYIGFDIKGVGIFGYILLDHENSNKATVELVGDEYVITQSASPEGGKLIPPAGDTSNDFYMGQRIYTDESHSFDAFIQAAEEERNPLTAIISKEYVNGKEVANNYVGYNALRGAYEFNIGGSGFNPPYFSSWNQHYATSAIVAGDRQQDRSIYVYTSHSGGCGEGAAILDKNDMLLPIPIMIFKNFGFENEEPIFDNGDTEYSEAMVPLVIGAKDKVEFTILNLYQNWGAFPLKQVSTIQYFAPYYHLSTGVTETSCISPWYVHGKSLWTLPDFRTMSGPWWFDYEGDLKDNQPQHTHAGYHYFLQYTDAEGKYSASENISNIIGSAGLNYGEIEMNYLSDDGRIKVSYNHIEYPQTDEHRAYYEMTYEVLEDVSFKNFAKDFSLYSTKAYTGSGTGSYQKFGYLDENNESRITDALTNRTTILGKNCPYFDFFELQTTDADWQRKNGNTAVVIYNSDITIGGEKFDGNFVIVSEDNTHSLSLNLGAVTLKKGDKFTINMIIVPWGSENSTDDSNVRTIRENSCLKPLTLEAVNGKNISSAFVPRIKSADGATAEFTLSGGANNVAVRVYGIKKLTAPKIYEKIDGEWVEYITSSINSEDKLHNKHYYDGYFAYYDGNGTYSYTFPIDIGDGSARTFKVDASEDFKKWPEIPKTENASSLDVYIDHEQISATATSSHGMGKIELGDSYVRFYGDGTTGEAYFTPFKPTNATGQYVVFKYRYNEGFRGNNEAQIYTSTVNAQAENADFFRMKLNTDGEWHIAIADLTKQGLPTFTDTDGEYFAKHVRFDYFNSITSTDDYFELAYFGMADSLDDICLQSPDDEYAYLYEGAQIVQVLDIQTGDVSDYDGSASSGSSSSGASDGFIGKNSGYTAATVPYVSRIDFVNGKGDGEPGNAPYNNKGGMTSRIDTLLYNGPTAAEAKLALSGWTLVYGGVEKYVWSADGGKTWHDAALYNRDSFDPASGAYIDSANGTAPGTDFSPYASEGLYQGQEGVPQGVAADLSAYVGKTVNVTFAAVPKTDTATLCIIGHIEKVRVYASADDAQAGEAAAGFVKESPYIAKDSGYSESNLAYAAGIDMINAYGQDGAATFANKGGNSAKGVEIFNHNGTTMNGSWMIFSGWTVVEGGIARFVFSADGGKTWQDASLYNMAALGDAYDGILQNAVARAGSASLNNYGMGTVYQTPVGDPENVRGVACDLSAYKGQTIDITFAAVPTADQDTLCLIAHVTGIQVQ